ncbi:unnamed protein product, partial [Rotaria sp. Silwood1]
MDSSDPTKNLVKLTNFSMACPIGHHVSNKRMTDDLMQYYAPEIRQNENKPKYSELSDVYSMGVLMWQACSKGTIPYGRDTKDGEIQQRKSNKGKLSQPKQCQNKLWEIILDCLHSQLESQYNFAQ